MIYKIEDRLRDLLVGLGGHEHITDPLVSHNEKAAGNQIVLENSQNSQKDALRTSIADTLKEIVPNYTKNQISNGVLFEIGKTYSQHENINNFATYKETRILECLVFDKEKNPKDLHTTTSSLLHSLLSNLGRDDYSLKKQTNLLEAIVIVDDLELGSIKYNGFTLFTENILASTKQPQRVITDIQTSNSLETSLIIPNNLPAGTIIDALKKTNEIARVSFLGEYKGKELGNDQRSISLKIRYKEGLSSSETLSMNKSVIDKLKKTYGVIVRD
jgi:phenylalanyl-tRNA synthetase beta subunit